MVNPSGERTLGLFVHEKPVLLIHRMNRNPAQSADPQFHTGALPDAAGRRNHANRRKCRRQELQRIRTFVKPEHRRNGRMDHHALFKSGHDSNCRLFPARGPPSRNATVPPSSNAGLWPAGFGSTGKRAKLQRRALPAFVGREAYTTTASKSPKPSGQRPALPECICRTCLPVFEWRRASAYRGERRLFRIRRGPEAKPEKLAPSELSKVELALELAGWKPALLRERSTLD